VKQQIYLSRRNLLTLLSKLDRKAAGEHSECTLIKRDNVHPKYSQTMKEIYITAVEDEDYYVNREPGIVFPEDNPMNANPSMLQKELDRYNAELSSLLNDEGRFAVIKNDNKIEIFDTYDDALKYGYEEYGLEPFLVQQISRVPNVANFTRFPLAPCQA
jgi:hypothetical protein